MVGGMILNGVDGAAGTTHVSVWTFVADHFFVDELCNSEQRTLEPITYHMGSQCCLTQMNIIIIKCVPRAGV